MITCITFFTRLELSWVETSPWVWPIFSSPSWLSAPSLAYASLYVTCKTKVHTKWERGFHWPNSRYLAAIISPDVRFHKLGCVEPLFLVSCIHVPWDSILFKSIPERKMKVIYILHFSKPSQSRLCIAVCENRGITSGGIRFTRNANGVFLCVPANKPIANFCRKGYQNSPVDISKYVPPPVSRPAFLLSCLQLAECSLSLFHHCLQSEHWPFNLRRWTMQRQLHNT